MLLSVITRSSVLAAMVCPDTDHAHFVIFTYLLPVHRDHDSAGNEVALTQAGSDSLTTR